MTTTRRSARHQPPPEVPLASIKLKKPTRAKTPPREPSPPQKDDRVRPTPAGPPPPPPEVAPLPKTVMQLVVDEADPDLQESPSLSRYEQRRVRIMDDLEEIDTSLASPSKQGAPSSSQFVEEAMVSGQQPPSGTETPKEAFPPIFSAAPQATTPSALKRSTFGFASEKKTGFDMTHYANMNASPLKPSMKSSVATPQHLATPQREGQQRQHAVEASVQKRQRTTHILSTLADDAIEEEEEEEEEAAAPVDKPVPAQSTTVVAPPDVSLKYREFFARSQFKTSNNTLAQLPQLKPSQIKQLLDGASLVEHAEEKRVLAHFMQEQYPQWLFELHEGFNLCFYGYGSKREFIHHFAEQLKPFGHPILTINGYHPSITLADITSLIMQQFPAISRATFPASVDLIDVIKRHLAEEERKKAKKQAAGPKGLYLLIHNIDGPALRSHKMMVALAQLAQIPQIRLITSIDHINAVSLWDQNMASMLNFCFHDATTYKPYKVETTFENALALGFEGSGGRITATGVLHVLRSLTQNAKKAFTLLAEWQIAAKTASPTEGVVAQGEDDRAEEEEDAPVADEEGTTEAERKRLKMKHGAKRAQTMQQKNRQAKKDRNPNVFLGLAYKTFYNLCRNQFLVTTDLTFRTLLTEFRDHKIIVGKQGADGSEYLQIPLAPRILSSLLEKMV